MGSLDFFFYKNLKIVPQYSLQNVSWVINSDMSVVDNATRICVRTTSGVRQHVISYLSRPIKLYDFDFEIETKMCNNLLVL